MTSFRIGFPLDTGSTESWEYALVRSDRGRGFRQGWHGGPLRSPAPEPLSGAALALKNYPSENLPSRRLIEEHISPNTSPEDYVVPNTESSSAAACTLALLADEDTNEDTPLLLISCSVAYPSASYREAYAQPVTRSEPSTSEQERDTAMLLRKWEATRHGEAAALVLHERDASHLAAILEQDSPPSKPISAVATRELTARPAPPLLITVSSDPRDLVHLAALIGVPTAAFRGARTSKRIVASLTSLALVALASAVAMFWPSRIAPTATVTSALSCQDHPAEAGVRPCLRALLTSATRETAADLVVELISRGKITPRDTAGFLSIISRLGVEPQWTPRTTFLRVHWNELAPIPGDGIAFLSVNSDVVSMISADFYNVYRSRFSQKHNRMAKMHQVHGCVSDRLTHQEAELAVASVAQFSGTGTIMWQRCGDATTVYVTTTIQQVSRWHGELIFNAQAPVGSASVARSSDQRTFISEVFSLAALAQAFREFSAGNISEATSMIMSSLSLPEGPAEGWRAALARHLGRHKFDQRPFPSLRADKLLSTPNPWPVALLGALPPLTLDGRHNLAAPTEQVGLAVTALEAPAHTALRSALLTLSRPVRNGAHPCDSASPEQASAHRQAREAFAAYNMPGFALLAEARLRTIAGDKASQAAFLDPDHLSTLLSSVGAAWIRDEVALRLLASARLQDDLDGNVRDQLGALLEDAASRRPSILRVLMSMPRSQLPERLQRVAREILRTSHPTSLFSTELVPTIIDGLDASTYSEFLARSFDPELVARGSDQPIDDRIRALAIESAQLLGRLQNLELTGVILEPPLSRTRYISPRELRSILSDQTGAQFSSSIVFLAAANHLLAELRPLLPELTPPLTELRPPVRDGDWNGILLPTTALRRISLDFLSYFSISLETRSADAGVSPNAKKRFRGILDNASDIVSAAFSRETTLSVDRALREATKWAPPSPPPSVEGSGWESVALTYELLYADFLWAGAQLLGGEITTPNIAIERVNAFKEYAAAENYAELSREFFDGLLLLHEIAPVSSAFLRARMAPSDSPTQVAWSRKRVRFHVDALDRRWFKRPLEAQIRDGHGLAAIVKDLAIGLARRLASGTAPTMTGLAHLAANKSDAYVELLQSTEDPLPRVVAQLVGAAARLTLGADEDACSTLDTMRPDDVSTLGIHSAAFQVARAFLSWRAGRVERAVEDFKDVQRRCPSHSTTLGRSLALALGDLGLHEEALKTWISSTDWTKQAEWHRGPQNPDRVRPLPTLRLRIVPPPELHVLADMLPPNVAHELRTWTSESWSLEAVQLDEALVGAWLALRADDSTVADRELSTAASLTERFYPIPYPRPRLLHRVGALAYLRGWHGTGHRLLLSAEDMDRQSPATLMYSCLSVPTKRASLRYPCSLPNLNSEPAERFLERGIRDPYDIFTSWVGTIRDYPPILGSNRSQRYTPAAPPTEASCDESFRTITDSPTDLLVRIETILSCPVSYSGLFRLFDLIHLINAIPTDRCLRISHSVKEYYQTLATTEIEARWLRSSACALINKCALDSNDRGSVWRTMGRVTPSLKTSTTAASVALRKRLGDRWDVVVLPEDSVPSSVVDCGQ